LTLRVKSHSLSAIRCSLVHASFETERRCCGRTATFTAHQQIADSEQRPAQNVRNRADRLAASF
jgi:hypothetical protein